MRGSPGLRTLAATACVAALLLLAGVPAPLTAQEPPWVLIGLGDSLTHGTMDAANNTTNTSNAYLQRVRDLLAQQIEVLFTQPFFDDVTGDRVNPFDTPTNVGVDGEDSFSIEGLEYYKRAGTTESLPSPSLMVDKWLPSQLEDTHDKVLYPFNVLARRPMTQMDSAEWLLREVMPASGLTRALVVYWIGNNDSSTAALGYGGANPTFMPIPAEQLKPVMPLTARLLLAAEAQGQLSLQPYTAASIDRNLTAIDDFHAQQLHLLSRLTTAGNGLNQQVFVLTVPYYSSIGYLMDSDDLEYYFRKIDPAYTVPPSFARVAEPGQAITDPTKGDRISLLTFGLMYALLDSGFSSDYVNGVLEQNGQQQDGLVLSEAEQASIRERIDAFNATLQSHAAPNVHVLDIGGYLNDLLLGNTPLVIDGRQVSRKWIRGGAFTFDGVHPGYTGQALIANLVVEELNEKLGIDAPLASLDAVAATDPYVDRDGDGFAVGPAFSGSGFTEILFLLKDPDDADAQIQPDLPDDVWQLIVRALLKEVLDRAPALQPEAERLGLF
jgi:hypothetical protein